MFVLFIQFLSVCVNKQKALGLGKQIIPFQENNGGASAFYAAEIS